MQTIKMWAWVYSDEKSHRIISIDETKEIVAAEKRERLYGKKMIDGVCLDKELSDRICETNRILYRKTKVVPVTVTIPT